MKRNILVVYDYAPLGKIRSTIRDHLYGFKKYAKHNVFYLNLAYRETIPWHVKRRKFDLVIFHTIFFTARWDEVGFQRTMRKARFLKALDAVKVGMPQDEHFKTDYICRIIEEFGLQMIYSVGPEEEWSNFYRDLEGKISIHPVLTGYLDEKTVNKIQSLAARVKDRTWDIGYRARKVEPSLGRHGQLKPLVAEVFLREAAAGSLHVNISTRAEDTILGDKWYAFLLACKYTIGVEGGASILDRDGSLRTRVLQYLEEHPDASFEEVEERLFPGRDGELQYFAISPRHLEACATKTCQILIEGRYNGILKPGVHYLELKRDFSNLSDVMEKIKSDELREAMVERAYRDIVQSGKYTYRLFVKSMLEQSLTPEAMHRPALFDRLICRWNWLVERIHPYRISFVRQYRKWMLKWKKRP